MTNAPDEGADTGDEANDDESQGGEEVVAPEGSELPFPTTPGDTGEGSP